jgi:hypothetical protein
VYNGQKHCRIEKEANTLEFSTFLYVISPFLATPARREGIARRCSVILNVDRTHSSLINLALLLLANFHYSPPAPRSHVERVGAKLPLIWISSETLIVAFAIIAFPITTSDIHSFILYVLSSSIYNASHEYV